MPPRRHALIAPMTVPKMNARIVVMPTRPSVHGNAERITWLTDSGKNEIEIPKLPVKQLREVVEVLREQALVAVDAEGDLQRVQGLPADPAVEAPDQRLRRVARHQPRDEEVDRQRRPEREGEEAEPPQDDTSPATHFGCRCSRTTSTSGTWKADGSAIGFDGESQPENDAVSYS